MFAGKSRRKGFGLRAAVVLAAAGALVFGGASAASAYGTNGSLDRQSIKPNSALPPGGAKIGTDQGDSATVQTNQGEAPVVVITLTFSDGTVKHAYCIDYSHHAGKTGTQYNAGQWNESNVKNLPKIQWILQNSFPNKDATPLLQAAGVDDTDGLNTQFDAYVATQTAIWNFSDNIELKGAGRGLSGPDYAAVEKVHDYLIEKASDASEPQPPQVSISPQQATGNAGEKIGPFTVSASGVKGVNLTADNGQVVDKNGNPVSSLGNGAKFWVRSDSEGSVSVAATGSGVLPSGSVFMVPGHENTYQKLILADTATQEVGAKVSVTVTSKPSPSPSSQSPSASPSSSAAPASPSASGTAGGGLPVTGTSLPIIVGVALVLLAGGGAAVVLARRRRMTH